jgi:heme-degrading monooxygenase HmoA
MHTPTDHFATLWEFEVAPAHQAEFIAAYGPTGAWAQLFAKADGYVGTLLLNDQNDPKRYVTVDRWMSQQAYEAFLAEYRAEYEQLDVDCERLTLREAHLGSYWVRAQ